MIFSYIGPYDSNYYLIAGQQEPIVYSGLLFPDETCGHTSLSKVFSPNGLSEAV